MENILQSHKLDLQLIYRIISHTVIHNELFATT